MGLTDYFTFDGERSSDYGFYASGKGVYNTPEQDYETIEVPGRNGDIVIYNNRFKNVDVTYPCIIEMREEDFPAKISEFRNMLMSRIGYKRLEDTHNPNEFRMAMCKNVIEVDPTEYDLISKTNVVFNCKPQRFLKSGEIPINLEEGVSNTVVNPTLFESKPLIIITADDDGAVYVNEMPIIFSPNNFGTLALENTRPQSGTSGQGAFSYTTDSTWDTDFYNRGDSINANDDIYVYIKISGYPSVEYVNVDEQALETYYNMKLVSMKKNSGAGTVEFTVKVKKSLLAFRADTGKTINFKFYALVEYKVDPGSPSYISELDFDGTITYGETAEGFPDFKSIKFEQYGRLESLEQTGAPLFVDYSMESFPPLSVYSTKSAFAGEVYFDSETSEAYTFVDGDKVFVNNQVSAGYGFPVLRPGVNGISFYGGVQTCRVVPRWWII